MDTSGEPTTCSPDVERCVRSVAYGECVLEQFGEQEDAERSVAFSEAKEACKKTLTILREWL